MNSEKEKEKAHLRVALLPTNVPPSREGVHDVVVEHKMAIPPPYCARLFRNTAPDTRA